MNNNELYLDALTGLSMHVAYQNINFDEFKVRNATLRSWALEFVQRYAGTDWQKVDFTILVGVYAVEKVNQYREIHPQQVAVKPFNSL